LTAASQPLLEPKVSLKSPTINQAYLKMPRGGRFRWPGALFHLEDALKASPARFEDGGFEQAKILFTRP
jgi:hypothetical protein